MSDTEKEKDVSCFKLDGVVAEMVIEVEDNQKSGLDELKDISSSSAKDVTSDPKDEDLNSEKRIEDDASQSEEMQNEKREDKENVLEISESDEGSNSVKEDENVTKTEDKTNSQNVRRKRKRELAENYKEMNKKVTDAPRYSGRKRLANKRYNSEYITSQTDKSDSDNSKVSGGVKRKKLDSNSKDAESKAKVAAADTLSKKSEQSYDESDPNVEEGSVSSLIEESISDNKDDSVSDKAKSGSEEIKMETEEVVPKKNVLRKLPFRKNKNAPDVPDLKPAVNWYNGVGEGVGAKLGDIPDVKERIKRAKNVRALYRVLFFQWPTNGQDLVGQILEFNGFPFEKSSYEFNKRKSLMKIMLDVTISHISELLDLKTGDKSFMIDNILNFLLRPYKKIDPALEPSLQPVVLLERLDLGGKYLNQNVENIKLKKNEASTKGKLPLTRNKSRSIETSPITLVRETRNSKLGTKSDSTKAAVTSKEDLNADKDKTLKKKVGRPPSKNVSAEKKTTKLGGPSSSKSVAIEKNTAKPGRPPSLRSLPTEEKTVKLKEIKPKATLAAKDTKTSANEKKSKDDEETAETKGKSEISIKPSEKTASVNLKKKILKKKMKVKNPDKLKISEEKSDKESKNKSLETIEEKDTVENKSKGKTLGSKPEEDTIDTDYISEPDLDFAEDTEMKEDRKLDKSSSNNKASENKKKVTLVSPVTLSDSSETESSEETKLMTTSQMTPKYHKKSRGKPLGLFSNISECIQKANFSALQRLHILLFGASDKADNLKANILAFAGFPFLEGSDEWKQKHFLLSLLAQNNLREYLNLLCIQYSDDDQPKMIDKLMKFLAAPSDNPNENNSREIETEVVSSELTNASPSANTAGTGARKKKVKKKEPKKTGNRHRKVLMSEEEARRLEASFAREQRAIAREQKAPPPIIKNQPYTTDPGTSTYQSIQPKKRLALIKPAVADANELNALLQTVYKRRALKAAGAIVSLPNKGQRTKLGDIENIKFLIVTANIPDLEILHRLIFMLEASKSRVRKNILDFEGFHFNEDSPKYQMRMEYLNRMGYDVSKRISFLLGLCTLQTEIPQQDLNELIMYFLMSPCKTKQVVPITEMPIVPTLGTSDESQFSQSDFGITSYEPVVTTNKVSLTNPPTPSTFSASNMQTSTPLSKTNRQKAKKSFASALKVSPVKKVLLPPSQLPVVGAVLTKQTLNKSPMTLLNSVPAVPTYALAKPPTTANLLNPPANVSKTLQNVNSYVNVPLVTAPKFQKVQLVSQGSNVAVIDGIPKFPTGAVSNTTGKVIQNQVILVPSVPPNKIAIQPQTIAQPQNVVKAPVMPGSNLLKCPTGFTPSGPQEYLVQQQTPDGQQKTFKLIRLPSNHPLASTVGKPIQTVVSTPGQQPMILSSSQPSLVVMKENPGLLSAVQKLQTNLQNASNKVEKSSSVSTQPMNVTVMNTPQLVLSTANVTPQMPVKPAKSLEVQDAVSAKDLPPTDAQLFSSIQEIILSSNFEDITLRNVIERVSAQFSAHDLTHRHTFMKECVKKIIIGT